MTLASGRDAGTLLICNDPAIGRALGRACVVAGIAAPAWVVARGADLGPLEEFDCVVMILDPGQIDPEEPARLVETGRPLIVVGRRSGAAGDDGGWIAPAPGWETRVVELLLDHLGLTAALLPTYENRLRVLGRELDRRGYAAVSIAETADGFDVRPEAPGDARLASFRFTHRDFGRLAREALMARGERPWERPAGRLAPAGHERALRAIGRELDAACATRVQLVLLARSLVISGLRAASPYDAPEPFQELFRESHLADLERRTGQARRAPAGRLARWLRKLGAGS